MGGHWIKTVQRSERVKWAKLCHKHMYMYLLNLSPLYIPLIKQLSYLEIFFNIAFQKFNFISGPHTLLPFVTYGIQKYGNKKIK